MRSRGLVVAIAVVLAVAAAAAVVLYTQGVKNEVINGGTQTTVIVSTIDIKPNEQLDPLVTQEVFKEVNIPRSALVANAVTSLKQLEGATTTSPIFANEQIPTTRLSTGEPQNILGISEGHVGVSVELDAPQGGDGHVQPGDNVSIYASFQNVKLLAGNFQQLIPNPARIPTGNTSGSDIPDFTVTLIPTVRVLAISNPEVDAETGQQNTNDRIRVTLDLLPEDAQNLVFAQENGLVWMGLLPPNAEGPQIDGATVPLDLLLVQGAKLK